MIEEVSPSGTSRGGTPVPGGRRAHLDGLRTVAVYLVFLFHAVVPQATGGFIGVDVFFVLSGYLVTQVLTRDLAASGSIRLGHFYARRIRRLLPAATVVLVISGVTYSMLASPFEVDYSVDTYRAAFLYVANWQIIDQANANLGVAAAISPAFLFWSLAVEEQFYLVWPVLLGGLFTLTRRWSRQIEIIRMVLLAGVLGGVGWTILILETQGSARAYYGTDTRAYQLLAGALLALTPAVVSRVARSVVWANVLAVLAFGALAFVASSALDIKATERGFAATAVAVLLILSLEAAPRGVIARLLSLPPMVYLGLISYGTYLWQWPVVVVARKLANPAPWQLFVIAALVSTGLASLSYQMLERPIREVKLLDRVPRVVIVAGLATSVIGAFVLVPIILTARTD